MNFTFDTKNFKVETWYSYPTCVIMRFAEYEENGFHGTAGDKKVKAFFEDVLKYTENMLNKHLMDNKIAFKVLYVPTNTVFYVGYKDNVWSVGLDLNPYMNCSYKLDVDK